MKNENKKSEETFYKLRDEWNEINKRTLKEIQDVLETKPNKTMDLDDVSLDVKGTYECYSETFIKVRLEDGDIILTSSDEDEYNAEGDLSLGESLWLYYNIC